ncbi:MAG TPA: hemolysin D [Lacipirellulaceae bacterium]|nr:hemolysin D [Lacipirellulaceae bacterium]
MATLADSLVSSSSRTLPIRKRPDLKARRQRYQGQVYWVVKDPVGLQYFRFEEEEYAILQMLDGQLSLDEIADRFERDFPPQTIRTEELQQFIGMLHRSGLVITDAPGQGQQLVKRRGERKKQEWIATATNILSLRFKGVDPERFFNVVYPYVRWFFSVPAMVVCITLGLSALSLIIVNFDVFHSRLPTFHDFFRGPQQWAVLAITLCVTKILHEFGHGLSCKHFGGECHEIGVMFLVLTPCLYCNVSDSWMLPNRWHRAAIGAAGMYVELVLASIATFVWWFSEPGPLNYICLNVMFVCSVSTVMFNANPLLRYDGYYILSDILEIPNLRQKASTILNRKLGKWCLGLEEQEDPFLPQRRQGWFAAYIVASSLYRWFVTFAILFFLNRVFEPYGLKVIGQAIALGALYGLLIQPFWQLYQYFKVPGRLGEVKSVRIYGTLAVIAAVIIGIGFVPLPMHIYCPLEVQAQNAASVYVKVDGILEKTFVHPGDHVTKGQPLAQLRNIDIDINIAKLAGQRDVYAVQLDGLTRVSLADSEASAQIEPTRNALASTEEQLSQREGDRDLLRLVAPRDGTVLPPPLVEKQGDDSVHLPKWSGSPLDPENIGSHLMKGTKLCQIGDPNQMEARLALDQSDVELLENKVDWPVEIMLNQTADVVYVSKIESVSNDTIKTTPPHLSSLHGGDLPTKMDASGVPRPLSTVYQATVPLPKSDPHHLLRIGLVGRAKITAPPRTLWSRVVRYLWKTFNFDL